MCELLDEMGTPASVDLELKLRLLAHQGVQAVLLAQRMRACGAEDPLGLLEGLANSSLDLLPPVLHEMCSQELLDQMKRTVHEEGGNREMHGGGGK